MGSYLYRSFGKEFDVTIDGVPTRAKMCKYWMKPYWEIFDDALRGRCSSWGSDIDKRIFRSYSLQLGRMNSLPGVRVFVLSQIEDGKRPDIGDTVLVFPGERHYVIDDPNFENAKILYLHRVGGIWEARKEKIEQLAKVP